MFRVENGFGTLGLSACAEWILSSVQEFGVRTDLQRSWFHQVKLFLSFLICEAKTGPKSKLFRLGIGLGTPELPACAGWILNFVQEFGVRTDLQRSWFHQVKLVLSFLISEAKAGPKSKLFRLGIGLGIPGLAACAEWILNFVQEFGLRTDLQRSWFHQVKLFLSFLICEAKAGPTLKLFRLGIGLGTPGLAACAEWILNFVQEFGVRTDLQRSWFHQVKLFLSFLICEAKAGPTLKLFRLGIGLGSPGLAACAEWILNFVQEFGVRTDLQRSWFHQVKLFLSFLICEAKAGPTLKLFRVEN